MEKIIEYLKQPSTYVGIATIIAAFGVHFTDGFVQSVGLVCIAVIGLIEVIRKEGVIKHDTKEDEK